MQAHIELTDEQVRILATELHKNYLIKYPTGTSEQGTQHEWPSEENVFYRGRMADENPPHAFLPQLTPPTLSKKDCLTLLTFALLPDKKRGDLQAVRNIIETLQKTYLLAIQDLHTKIHEGLSDKTIAQVFDEAGLHVASLPLTIFPTLTQPQHATAIYTSYRHSLANSCSGSYIISIMQQDPILSNVLTALSQVPQLQEGASSETILQKKITIPAQSLSTDKLNNTLDTMGSSAKADPQILSPLFQDATLNIKDRAALFDAWLSYLIRQWKNIPVQNHQKIKETLVSALDTLQEHSDFLNGWKQNSKHKLNAQKLLGEISAHCRQGFFGKWARSFAADTATRTQKYAPYGYIHPEQAWRKWPLFILACFSPANLARGILYPFFHGARFLTRKSLTIAKNRRKNTGIRIFAGLGFAASLLITGPLWLAKQALDPLANAYMRTVQYAFLPRLPAETPRPWWRRAFAAVGAIGIIGLSIACILFPPLLAATKIGAAVAPISSFLSSHFSGLALQAVSLSAKILIPGAVLSTASLIPQARSRLKTLASKIRSSGFAQWMKNRFSPQTAPTQDRTVFNPAFVESRSRSSSTEVVRGAGPEPGLRGSAPIPRGDPHQTDRMRRVRDAKEGRRQLASAVPGRPPLSETEDSLAARVHPNPFQSVGGHAPAIPPAATGTSPGPANRSTFDPRPARSPREATGSRARSSSMDAHITGHTTKQVTRPPHAGAFYPHRTAEADAGWREHTPSSGSTSTSGSTSPRPGSAADKAMILEPTGAV